jgi:hypothetical protein
VVATSRVIELLSEDGVTVWFCDLKLRFPSENQTMRRVGLLGLPRAYARGYGSAALTGLRTRRRFLHSFWARLIETLTQAARHSEAFAG